MRRALARWGILAVGVASFGYVRTASAFEHQHHLGLDTGLSMLKIDDKSTLSVGAGLGVHYTYGLNDQFNLVAEGTGSIVALDEAKGANIPKTHPSHIETLGLGITYVIDVLQWVPYVGVLGTGYTLGGGSMDRTVVIAGAQVAAGLDYAFSRQFAMGFAYRQHLLLTQMSTYPSYSNFFLRAEYTWGF